MRIITVIPLLEPKADRLPGPLAQELTARTLDTALAWTGADGIVALSNDAELCRFARGRGISATLVEGAWGRHPLDLPPAAWAALRAHAASTGESCAAFLVHPHNALLRPELLERASKAFYADTSKPLVSVQACHDHPCQLARYYRLEDMDTLYLLDPGFNADSLGLADNPKDLAVSLPFVQSPKEQMLSEAPVGGLSSCADGRALTSLENGQAWLKESATTARMVFSKALALTPLTESTEVRGKPCGVFGVQCGHAALLRQERENTLTLLLGPDFPRSTGFILRLIPFSAQGALWEYSLDFIAGTPGHPLRLPLVSAPVPAKSLPPESTGCLACILEESIAGSFDFGEPYQPSLAPWSLRKGHLCNLDTGEKIFGRQAFPAVQHADGVLAVLPLTPTGGEPDSPPDMSAVRGLLLDEAEALVVADQVDHLRALAHEQILQRARRG